jgi:predicted ATPase
MRIEHFTVQEYQVLHQLTLNMDLGSQSMPDVQKTYKLDLIVGVNGTGKTTLLRLLAELFQRLENKQQDIPFKFSITYLLRNKDEEIKITISNQDEDRLKKLEAGREIGQEKRPFYIKVEDLTGRPPSKEDLVDTIERQYLPNYVVALTSGSEKGWEIGNSPSIDNSGDATLLPRKEQPDFEQNLLGWYQRERKFLEPSPASQTPANQVLSNFLFIRNQYLPLVILCGMLVNIQKQEHILTDALHEVKIKALSGFSLRFNWDESAIFPDDNTFIDRLIKLSSYTIKQNQNQNHSSLLLVFNLHTVEQGKPSAIQRAEELIQLRGDALKLFQDLNLLMQRSIPILQEVNLFFERDYTLTQQTETNLSQTDEQQTFPLHTLEWFSDGEISFLGRFCLFSLLRDVEALVLLDEPEVHFNDYWKRQLVHKLDRALHGEYSHVIMTTHSSITLSDVYSSNIWVMQRNGDFTTDVASPNVRTLGTDPSDIIVHIFGAESAVGAHSSIYIRERVRWILEHVPPDEKVKELKALVEKVGPGYWRYLIRREILSLEAPQIRNS